MCCDHGNIRILSATELGVAIARLRVGWRGRSGRRSATGVSRAGDDDICIRSRGGSGGAISRNGCIGRGDGGEGRLGDAIPDRNRSGVAEITAGRNSDGSFGGHDAERITVGS